MNREEPDALKDAAMALSEKGVAEAWDIELCRRINKIESGEAELLEPDEVLARARERIRGSTSGATTPAAD